MAVPITRPGSEFGDGLCSRRLVQSSPLMFAANDAEHLDINDVWGSLPLIFCQPRSDSSAADRSGQDLHQARGINDKHWSTPRPVIHGFP